MTHYGARERERAFPCSSGVSICLGEWAVQQEAGGEARNRHAVVLPAACCCCCRSPHQWVATPGTRYGMRLCQTSNAPPAWGEETRMRSYSQSLSSYRGGHAAKAKENGLTCPHWSHWWLVGLGLAAQKDSSGVSLHKCEVGRTHSRKRHPGNTQARLFAPPRHRVHAYAGNEAGPVQFFRNKPGWIQE